MATAWTTVAPSLDPLLAPVQPILDSVDSILESVIAILNVMQSLLNIIKAFLVGLIDPLRPLVELILDEIRSLIADLRQLGVYLTGDMDLITPENNFGNLLGGYSAYERRMLGRLLDRRDPNRPDFTSSTTVVGVFFYASSEDINEVIRLMSGILKFFGQSHQMKKVRAYNAPTAPELSYGAGSASLASFRQLGQMSIDLVPDSLSASWSMPSSAGGLSNVFSPAPKGFLIHVSTIRDGFMVVSQTPKDDVASGVSALPQIVCGAVDPATSSPLRVYGGIADIAASDSDSTDFSQVEAVSPQAPLLLLQVDQNTPLIKPSLLKNGDIPLIANTYYVRVDGPLRGGPGTKYTAVLSRDQLPQHASFSTGTDGFAQIEGETEDATTFYVRVRALTEDYVDALQMGLTGTLSAPASVYTGTQLRPFRFSPQLLRQSRTGVLVPEPPGPKVTEQLSVAAFTQASGAATATFPAAVQMQYIEAVKCAILVAVLCRADLTESADDTFHTNVCAPGQSLLGLEGAGRDLIAHFGISPLWFKGNRPNVFRQKLRWLMDQITSELQSKGAPPDAVAEAIVALAAPMLSFTWSDIGGSPEFQPLTILESIGESVTFAGTSLQNSEQTGVGGNPYCRSEAKKVIDGWYSVGLGPAREPAFMVRDGDEAAAARCWMPGDGSADYSPIIYVDPASDSTGVSARVEFIRNALMSHQDGVVVSTATQVLQLAGAMVSRPQGDTQWTAIRLMPQALVPLDQLLERLERFMSGILDGLDGVTEKIVAYIDAIQARIYQLQALLEQIRALLRSLDFFSIPSAAGLVLVESGTDGLTTALVGSTNKPSDEASAYGGGVLVVAGGLPTVLLEMIALMLEGG